MNSSSSDGVKITEGSEVNSGRDLVDKSLIKCAITENIGEEPTKTSIR